MPATGDEKLPAGAARYVRELAAPSALPVAAAEGACARLCVVRIARFTSEYCRFNRFGGFTTAALRLSTGGSMLTVGGVVTGCSYSVVGTAPA